MGNRCGFQDQWDSFVRILSSNSPAAFGGSPRRPLMYCIHEDKPGSAVLKKPPKISLAQTDVCFSLLLCVPRGLAGDSALCQLHSGIHGDGEAPIGPRLVTTAGYRGLATCAIGSVTSYFHSHFLGQTKAYARAQLQLGAEAQFSQVVRRGRPDIGEQPNLCHIHFPAEDAPSSPVSLTRDEEVLTGNLGRCAWSLKPKQGNIFRVQSEVD